MLAGTIAYRSDWNQGSDYIAVFVSLTFGLRGKNKKSKITILWRINFFHLNQDVDANSIQQVTWK